MVSSAVGGWSTLKPEHLDLLMTFDPSGFNPVEFGI